MKGLYLQGAGWDMKSSCLVEAEPMQLVCPIPTIHFRPVETKRRSQKGTRGQTDTLADSLRGLYVMMIGYSVVILIASRAAVGSE